MERKDACKYSLKRSKKLKLYLRKKSVKLNNKDEANLVSDPLYQSLVFFAKPLKY